MAVSIFASWYVQMECGVLEGSGSSVCYAGWRSNATCFAKRAVFTAKNGRFVGARLRFLRFSPGSWIHRTRREYCLTMLRAEKRGNGNDDVSEGEKTRPPVTVRVSGWLIDSRQFWLQVAIFVFAAGFLDAGYSGDWSRIGVLSKETEVELQIAAIGVVPLAAALIWSISKRGKSS